MKSTTPERLLEFTEYGHEKKIYNSILLPVKWSMLFRMPSTCNNMGIPSG
jgi:hypothetical protein